MLFLYIMKKILVIYYSQSGQLPRLADSVFSGLSTADQVQVDYYPIKPVQDFPFPWPADAFFDAMPESVRGIPMALDMDDFPVNEQYHLVVLAYQVWYLSPSIPVSSFLQHEKARMFLRGKHVITLLGVRNMWVMAQEKVKILLKEAKAELVGNIVFSDRAHNLVSVITIVRWLIDGDKGPYRYLPEAGVSLDDMTEAARFGSPIVAALNQGVCCDLQQQLLDLGAVRVQYPIMRMEKVASRIFYAFAGFVRRKGGAGDPRRLGRIRLFKWYLYFVIFVVSPFAQFVFALRQMLFMRGVRQEISDIQHV